MLISAGNFHGEYMAKSADYISQALFSVGRFSEARIERYLNERISNLPGFLVKNGGLNSGFMIVQCSQSLIQTHQLRFSLSAKFSPSPPQQTPFLLRLVRKTMCLWADLQPVRAEKCSKTCRLFWESSSCTVCKQLTWWAKSLRDGWERSQKQ